MKLLSIILTISLSACGASIRPDANSAMTAVAAAPNVEVARCSEIDESGRPSESGYTVLVTRTNGRYSARVNTTWGTFSGSQPLRTLDVTYTFGTSTLLVNGAEFLLKVDLEHGTRFASYPGVGSVTLKEQPAGGGSSVQKNVKLKQQCTLPEYIPPTARALEGFMAGRGPAVDSQGLNRLDATLKSLVNRRLVHIVFNRPAGDEGGQIFCVELQAQQQNRVLSEVFKELNSVEYNRRSTSYRLTPSSVCRKL